MKKTFITLTLIASTIAGLTSCSKSSDSSPSVSMSAKIGNTTWTPDSYVNQDTTIGNVRHLIIQGFVPSTGQVMSLSVVNYAGSIGTFNVLSTPPYPSSYAVMSYSSGTSSAHTAKSGSITLSTISGKNVQGTFNFITTDSLSITNGTFNVQLQ